MKWKENNIDSVNEALWVLQKLGGKLFIKTVNEQEPNTLRERVYRLFEQYAYLPKQTKGELEYNPNITKQLEIKKFS